MCQPEDMATTAATAAVLRDPNGPYTLETINLRELLDHEVLVRIVGVGMCHTDVLPRAPGFIAAPPIVTGHEGAGVIEAVGASVTTLQVGDHVVLSFDSCGACATCAEGRPAYCETFIPRNLFGRALDGTVSAHDADGQLLSTRWFGQSSFATHCIATERNAVKVDASLPLAKLGPLGCGIQTGAGSMLVAMKVAAGSSVAVFGAGAVGLAAVMAAKVAGATTIIAIDLHQHRLDLAMELGATHVIDGGVNPDGLAFDIIGITGGGVHTAFDTTGIPSVVATALTATRLGGQLGLVGVQTGPYTFDAGSMTGKTVHNILEGSADPHTFIPQMIELWQQGRFPFDRLIEEFPLREINAAEHSSLQGGVIKPVLIP
jgi:aryl-alcohol dehydrogenase